MRTLYRLLLLGLTPIILGIGLAESAEDSGEEQFPSAELLARVAPKGQHDPQAVLELEKLRSELSDPRKRAIADLLIAAQHSVPGSPMSSKAVRELLKKVSDAHPATWISAAANLARAGTYGSLDPHQERIQAWLDALNDQGLAQFQEGSDPLLESLLTTEAKQNAEVIEDIIYHMLVFIHATGFDLKSAQEAANNIKSETWKTHAAKHLIRLQQLDPDELAEKQKKFIQNQMSIHQQPK